jgi:hypothetical protein
MALSNSPLFTAATRAAQQAIRRQWERSDYGRLLNEVKRSASRATVSQQVKGALQRYKRAASPQAAIRDLMGADIGGLVRGIERYARQGGATKAMVQDFLGTLGPAGKVIQSLIDPSRKTALAKQLQQAMELIRAFGGEVMPGAGWGTVEDVERGMRAAQRRLEQLGGPLAVGEGPPRRMPNAEPGRLTVDVPLGRRGRQSSVTQRVRADHPMLTGEMVYCPNSSNVYEFGYDNETATLYVRFQTAHEERQRGGAGSLYAYYGVTPDEFLALYKTQGRGLGQGGDSTPGTWVWDHLRERGTVSGHKKDYRLVGVMNSYVPRKATVRATYQTIGKRGQALKRPRKTGVEEWYISRSVKTHEGRFVHSVLPTTRVAATRGPR